MNAAANTRPIDDEYYRLYSEYYANTATPQIWNTCTYSAGRMLRRGGNNVDGCVTNINSQTGLGTAEILITHFSDQRGGSASKIIENCVASKKHQCYILIEEQPPSPVSTGMKNSQLHCLA